MARASTNGRLEAAIAVLNGDPELARSLTNIGVSDEAITMSIQEGHSAVVVHLLGTARADVLYVGEPSRAARRRLAVLCEEIGRAWTALGFMSFGTMEGCVLLAAPPSTGA